jgi:hypothetical protein
MIQLMERYIFTKYRKNMKNIIKFGDENGLSTFSNVVKNEPIYKDFKNKMKRIVSMIISLRITRKRMTVLI